jgi:hypothetical protein
MENRSFIGILFTSRRSVPIRLRRRLRVKRPGNVCHHPTAHGNDKKTQLMMPCVNRSM